jgi:Phosphohydrolase-associated domain
MISDRAKNGYPGSNKVQILLVIRIPRRRFDPAAGTRELKEFLRAKVYCSDAVTRTRSQFTGRIAALFEFFSQHPDRLPAAYRAESAGEPLHRSVCDYIAGMTDGGFFLRTCEQWGIAGQ